jgi:uncharacterized protein YndB with AHSA1/START domain
MTDAVLKPRNPATQEIVVEEVFPHAPEVIWKTLTTGALIGRWLMTPVGFEAVKGNRFTYQTKPAGAWDGTIHCEVLEAIPNERLAYAWKGGHEGNVGYGAPLETIVTFTLAKAASGTRLRLVHSGFELPGNESAFKTMGEGWKKVVRTLDSIAAEQDPANEPH